MKRGKSKHRKAPKRVLRLPDLDHTKLAVLNTLGSPGSQRSYRFAIDDFITWYCSEPRIAFDKTVVLRFAFSWKQGTLLRRQSICGSPPFVVSPTKQLTLVC
jgi:hypothetical protein